MSYAVLIVAVMGISFVQLMVKYRLDVAHGAIPADNSIVSYLFSLLADPWLWLAGIALIVSALLWYFALSRLYLSAAIAFAALVYPIVMIGSVIFLGENVAMPQALGCLLIVAGIWLVVSYSQAT